MWLESIGVGLHREARGVAGEYRGGTTQGG